MKSKTQLWLAAVMATATLNAHGQANLNVLASAGGSGNVFGQAGDINLTSYDKNTLETLLVKHFQQNQKEDREYIQSLVREIEIHMSNILQEAYRSGGLREMADKSLTSRRIDFVDYLAATRSFEKMLADTQLKIQGLLTIPSSLRGAQNVTVNGQVRTEIPAALKVDLTAVQNHYQAQLNKVFEGLNKMTFLLDINGITQQVKGISFRPDRIPFNAAEIKKMRDEAIRDLALIRAKVEEDVNQFNLYTRRQLMASIRVFGKSQKYRLQLNQEGKDQNIQDLEELFWARSYMRAMYGEKLGTFAVDYTKRQLNWDFFATDNNLQFVGDFIRSDEQLTEFQDKLTVALVTQTSRSREVLARETSLLDRVVSAITWVKGEAPLAEINTVILKLMLGDIQEEMMLSKGGGLKAMRAQYRTRYYKDAASEAAVKARAQAYRGGDSQDIESDNLSTDVTTMRGAFSAAAMALDGVIDQLEVATQKLKAIDELRAQSEAAQRVRQRGEI